MPFTARSKAGLIRQVMHEYRHGKLHDGKGGPKIKDRRQAVAVALSIAREKGYK